MEKQLNEEKYMNTEKIVLCEKLSELHILIEQFHATYIQLLLDARDLRMNQRELYEKVTAILG